MRSGHAHRYQCRGDDANVGSGLCIGIGGVRVDGSIAAQILEAVSEQAVDAALLAAAQGVKAADDLRRAVARELEEKRYEASLAERRYEHVDPAKRHVARELEARWNAALERVAVLERRVARLADEIAARPRIDRDALIPLAHDLPTVWNAVDTDARAKQRLVRLLIEEIVVDLDDVAHEAVLVIHWIGGRHTEVRVPRRRSQPEFLRRLGAKLIKSGALPATQLMPLAPWQIPLAALDSEPVRIGLQDTVASQPSQSACCA